MRRTGLGGIALGLVVVVLSACATMETKQDTKLYERLRITDNNGVPLAGRSAISQLVDDFVANVVADNRINARFKGLKPPEVARFKANFADQLCQATGGPCSYFGRDMKAAHQGMKITDAEWNATVEAFVKALDKRRVPEKEKKELVALLGPMRGDIVGR